MKKISRSPAAAKVNKVIFTQNFTLLTFLISLCTVIFQKSKLKKQHSHLLHSGSEKKEKPTYCSDPKAGLLNVSARPGLIFTEAVMSYENRSGLE